MLIEHFIEFDLGGLSPLAKHVLLQLVIFMKKTKISWKILEWILIYC